MFFVFPVLLMLLVYLLVYMMIETDMLVATFPPEVECQAKSPQRSQYAQQKKRSMGFTGMVANEVHEEMPAVKNRCN